MHTWQQTRKPRPNVRKHPIDAHLEAMIEEPYPDDKTPDQEVHDRGMMFALVALYVVGAITIGVALVLAFSWGWVG